MQTVARRPDVAAEERGRTRESATGAARNIEGNIERSEGTKTSSKGPDAACAARPTSARRCLVKPAEPEFIQARRLCFEFAIPRALMPYQKTHDRVLLTHPKVGKEFGYLSCVAGSSR